MNGEAYDQYKMQSALQAEATEQQMAPYAPALQEQMQQSQAVLVEQTNPKKVIESIILRLRGLEKSPDGTLFRIADQKMNKNGIDNVWFILDSHINDNVRFGRFKEDEIKKLMEGISSDLVDDLTLNWREYGIKKKTDLDTINNSILFNIYAILKRAEDQNEKNWIGRISVENITSAPRIGSPKKDGFWSKFKL